MDEKLIELGLVDEPTVESLEAAYAALQRDGGLVSNPDIETAQKISEAKSFQQIQEALGRTSSSVSPTDMAVEVLRRFLCSVKSSRSRA